MSSTGTNALKGRKQTKVPCPKCGELVGAGWVNRHNCAKAALTATLAPENQPKPKYPEGSIGEVAKITSFTPTATPDLATAMPKTQPKVTPTIFCPTINRPTPAPTTGTKITTNSGEVVQVKTNPVNDIICRLANRQLQLEQDMKELDDMRRPIAQELGEIQITIETIRRLK